LENSELYIPYSGAKILYSFNLLGGERMLTNRIKIVLKYLSEDEKQRIAKANEIIKNKKFDELVKVD